MTTTNQKTLLSRVGFLLDLVTKTSGGDPYYFKEEAFLSFQAFKVALREKIELHGITHADLKALEHEVISLLAPQNVATKEESLELEIKDIFAELVAPNL